MATEKEIQFLADNFYYEGLIEMGFYDKSIKPDDYDGQIKRVCEYFGLKTIFQYDQVGMETKKYIQSDFSTFSDN